jgi:hypothetical protein
LPLDPTPVPTGPEFRVDAATARFHYNPAATALVDGGFVVVRDTFSSATSSNKAEYQKNYLSSDVYAQFYAADGSTPRTEPQLVASSVSTTIWRDTRARRGWQRSRMAASR